MRNIHLSIPQNSRKTMPKMTTEMIDIPNNFKASAFFKY